MSGAGPADRPDPSLTRMLDVFDVRSVDERRFAGEADTGGRLVVDGSQLLGQAIVAAAKTLPDFAVRSAHALFFRPVDVRQEVWFDVDVTHQGRTFAAVQVTVGQGDRRCASVTLLLDVEHPDVIRHDAAPPEVAPPERAIPVSMPMSGRELRLVGLEDPNDPAEVGPPELDAWLRYDPVPTRPDLARALIAHFTGHLSISTTMRPHGGLGTAMAHEGVSTAVMGIAITFHEPVEWSGWLLYHHHSVHAGAGMSFVRGQVFTEQGSLIASFTQDGMIRSFTDEAVDLSRPAEERL
jgi:acyl-CoA thioesterase-2